MFFIVVVFAFTKVFQSKRGHNIYYIILLTVHGMFALLRNHRAARYNPQNPISQRFVPIPFSLPMTNYQIYLIIIRYSSISSCDPDE